MGKNVNIGIAVLGFILILLYSASMGLGASANMLAIVFLMVYLWMTEAIPLAVTALIPIVMFPLLGVAKGQATASEYFNSTILIFLGGFLLSLTMEKWDLHKRIALNILKIVGTSPARILFGFMLATAFLSSVLSNVATTTMMFPIALAITSELLSNNQSTGSRNFSKGVMLGVAYSSSIGGISTLIGTAPNLAFQGIFTQNFPNAPSITFSNWLVIGVPIAASMLIITWFVLSKTVFKFPKQLDISDDTIQNELDKLGKMKYEEIIVSIAISIASMLWLFRSDIVFGDFVIPGWSGLFSFPKFIDDSTVAIAISSILFIIPAKNRVHKIADIQLFTKVPWDIIILFGGGFALAMGFEESGLSKSIGNLFSQVNFNNPIVLIFLVSFVVTFLTEMTSNTATTYTLLPILVSISHGLGVNPIILMLPATISASFAFMLPVATPPNAIVFSSGYIDIKDMMKAGLILNLIGAVLITIILVYISFPILGIDIYTTPSWVK